MSWGRCTVCGRPLVLQNVVIQNYVSELWGAITDTLCASCWGWLHDLALQVSRV